jgi:threonine/homoserine/homoserine lactone efflux protein
VVVVDAAFFALTGLALPILRRRDAAAGPKRGWVTAAAIAFALLELLAIVGSVLQKDVRLVALTGLGWIAAAAITWLVWFARRAPGAESPD